MTIATRIFLALTAVSVLILSLNAAITRWNFQRGFLDYVAEQELDTINAAAESLATAYQQAGGWDRIRDNPRRWNDLLRHSSGPRPGGSRMEPPGRPRSGPPPGGRAPGDPLELGQRISLTDASGALIMGRHDAKDSARTVAVIVDDITVGYVNLAPQRQLTDQIDQKFAKEQERSIYVIALAALVFAALISALLARQLTRPIRSLAAGARAISGGDYDTRIPEVRDDELGDLAHEFNELATTLEKNRVARRQWVADIAHELRTPLAILRGELDAIEDGVRSFDAHSQRSLQDEISRLMKLVGELHDLSVYDDGGQRYHLENFNIVAALSDILESSKMRLADAGIELVSQLPNHRIAVLADATKLERVFLNLVENTLRYTDAPGRLNVACKESGDSVVIEFADSAPGASPEALERLFDRLFRIDESRNRETGGSGLGLAICEAIVKAHHGRIEALASEHGGVLIRIHLPTVDSAKALS
jgi:two-component system sensor histidine kinase BaeS